MIVCRKCKWYIEGVCIPFEGIYTSPGVWCTLFKDVNEDQNHFGVKEYE